MVNYHICVFPHVAEIFGHCPAPALHPSCCLALISLAQHLSCSLSWFLLGSELLIYGGASNPGVIFTSFSLLWRLCLGLLTNRRVSRDSSWVCFAGSFMFLRYVDYCLPPWFWNFGSCSLWMLLLCLSPYSWDFRDACVGEFGDIFPALAVSHHGSSFPFGFSSVLIDSVKGFSKVIAAFSDVTCSPQW